MGSVGIFYGAKTKAVVNLVRQDADAENEIEAIVSTIKGNITNWDIVVRWHPNLF